MKKVRNKKGIWVGLAIVIALAGIGGGGYWYVDSLAYKTARVEAGVSVQPSDFMKKEEADTIFTDAKGNPANYDLTALGEHELYVKQGWFTHKVILTVQDTICPTGEVVPVSSEVGTEVEPELFVQNVQDATKVTIAYDTQPDYQQIGQQTVSLYLCDEGQNKTYMESTLYLSPIHEEMIVEVGSERPTLEDFVISGNTYSTTTDLEAIDMNELSSNEVDICVDGQEYVSVLKIVDTTPPEITVHDLQWYLGVPTDPKYFVEEMEDVTDIGMSFVKAPDVESGEEQQVEMIFTDEGGNSITKQAKITFTEDHEVPQIVGAQDMTVYLGRGASYRKDITIEDNCPEGLTLEVDSSQVVLSELGTYPVTYTARDYSGNESSVTVQLTVADVCYDEETVNELADAILANIITEDMTNYDKVLAIFNYVKTHVAYIGTTDKESWVKAAYEGFTTGKGDCFAFASTTKVLLTRAGIKNMDIEKIPTKSRHYWNLVDIGDGHGWYHLDTTPRKDHPTIFLWDEATLMAYSAQHWRSHNYDHDLYPVVP